MSDDEDSAKYPSQITDNYVVKDTVGTGGFAKVKVARHRMTGEKVAIKVMDKEELKKTNDLRRVKLEVEALKRLHHENIAQLYHFIETSNKFFLVLEYAPAGELFDYIVARDRLKEDEARLFFRQICRAVHHVHNLGYAHRDLKPENLLLDENRTIKLIDFGLIGHPRKLDEDMLKTCCGSAAYAAPELIRGDAYLGKPADMWSLGILLYALMCGFLPFDDDNTQRLYRLIQRGSYEIPPWLSDGSQRILAALLKHKPSARLTMEELLVHPWMTKGLDADKKQIDPESKLPPRDDLDTAVVSEMAKYYGISREDMTSWILEWAYDNVTAEYCLSLQRKRKGHSIKLPSNKGKVPAERREKLTSAAEASAGGSARNLLRVAHDTPTFGSSLNLAGSGENLHLAASSGPYLQMPGSIENLSKLVGQETGSGAASGGNSGLRPRAQTTSTKGGPSTNLGVSADLSASMNALSSMPSEPAATSMKRTFSDPDMSRDDGPPRRQSKLGELPTPTPLSAIGDRSGKGSGALRGSLASLRRGIAGIFGSQRGLNHPRKTKGIFNVATTSTKPAQTVLRDIVRACEAQGFEIKEKGYLVKVKVPGADDKTRVALSMEVCNIPAMELRGIKLKRLKGDVWQYKRACELVLDNLQL